MADHSSDPALASRERPNELLLKLDGQIVGPVPEEHLLELLASGRIGPATEVALDGGPWRPLSDVPGLLVHVKKAEAHARVAAELTGARQVARKRTVRHAGGVGLAVAVLAVLAAALAYVLAVHRPWETRSKLLEDFGGGITVEEVRVGGGARGREGAASDEIAVPAPAPRELPPPLALAGSQPLPRRAPHPESASAARAPPSSPPEGSGLVVSQYDPRSIEEVVARRQGSLASCLREEAQRSPDFAGTIPIEFAVGNDGRVTALWIDEPIFKSGPLQECLLARLRDWSFAPFPGERPVVSLSFRIGR